MKKIVTIIIFFVTLFLSGMIYFVVTIDKSFKLKDQDRKQIKKDHKTETFHDYYYEDDQAVS